MSMFELQFQPDGIRISASAGERLTLVMKRAGIDIQLPCGGTGRCGKCVVEIHPDPPEPTAFDRRHLSNRQLDEHKRLACMTKVYRDMRVLIMPGMRVLDGKILIAGTDRTFAIEPVITKTYLELPEPSLEDQTPDMLRLSRALGGDHEHCPPFDIELARGLPAILRDSGFRVTVTRSGERIIAVEPGDTTGRRYGMAFDIGTTTVVGTILDLADGRELAHASRLNAQVVFGEDTISRIKHAVETPDGRAELRGKIIAVINEIITDAATQAGIAPDDIYEAVMAGNTTMSHLLLGLDPAGLSQLPFVPVAASPVNLVAADAGIGIHPRGTVHVLPNVAGFVGSDTVAVMLACDYLEPGPVRLAVDVGTNGELALRQGGTITVCSTAAGPALEGATLTCGMRAAPGAIEHVRIGDGDLVLDTIGDTEPLGLCGSGIIDILACLLDAGLVDDTGQIVPPEELPDDVSQALRDRIVTVDDQPAVLLHHPADGGTARDVVLTQRDIRQIQLAKGAIRAGINLLLADAGLASGDLDELLLAGAFGNYITKSSAVRIGLLPDIGNERIRFVGNAASTGAKMVLLSARARADADRIRQAARHIELAALPAFMNEFMDTMQFPSRKP